MQAKRNSLAFTELSKVLVKDKKNTARATDSAMLLVKAPPQEGGALPMRKLLSSTSIKPRPRDQAACQSGMLMRGYALCVLFNRKISNQSVNIIIYLSLQ